jgi:hypothetical protein
MYMSISKKGLVNQLGPFEKPWIIIVLAIHANFSKELSKFILYVFWNEHTEFCTSFIVHRQKLMHSIKAFCLKWWFSYVHIKHSSPGSVPKSRKHLFIPFWCSYLYCWIIFTCLIHLFFLYPIYNNLVLQGLPLLEHMFFILLISGYYYNHVDWSNQRFQFCKSTIEMFCKETLTP